MSQALGKLIKSIGNQFSKEHFKKKSNRLWRVQGGVYHLIDFQKSSYGDWFYINICIHPVGMPLLRSDKIVVPDHPLEYECILRARLNQICEDSSCKSYVSFISLHSVDIDFLSHALRRIAIPWFSKWGNLKVLAYVDDSAIEPFLTVIPCLFDKACTMLKCYCSARLGDFHDARRQLARFIKLNSCGYNFSHIDQFLRDMLDNSSLKRTT